MAVSEQGVCLGQAAAGCRATRRQLPKIRQFAASQPPNPARKPAPKPKPTDTKTALRQSQPTPPPNTHLVNKQTNRLHFYKKEEATHGLTQTECADRQTGLTFTKRAKYTLTHTSSTTQSNRAHIYKKRV